MRFFRWSADMVWLAWDFVIHSRRLAGWKVGNWGSERVHVRKATGVGDCLEDDEVRP